MTQDITLRSDFVVQLVDSMGRDDRFMYLCQAIIERDGQLPERWFQ